MCPTGPRRFAGCLLDNPQLFEVTEPFVNAGDDPAVPGTHEQDARGLPQLPVEFQRDGLFPLDRHGIVGRVAAHSTDGL